MLVVRSVLQALCPPRGVHVPCGQRTFWPFRSARVTKSVKVVPRIEEKLTETFLHGKRWLDPYGYMKDDEAGLQDYLAAETRHAQAWMQPLSALQRQLQKELLQHSPDQQESLPAPLGEWCYTTQALDDCPGLKIIRRDAAGHEEVVLDLSDTQDSNAALGQMKISLAQHMVAFTLEKSPGSERYTGYVGDIETGNLVDMVSDADGIEFAADGGSLAYTVSDAAGRPYQIRLRRIGDSPSSSKCLMEQLQPEMHLHISRTKDWRYLLLNANSKSTSEALLLLNGTVGMKVHLLDASDPWNATPILVRAREPGVMYFVEHHDSTLYIMTNAGRGEEMRIVTADPSKLPLRDGAMDRLVEMETGNCIEDMEMFRRALVLYIRAQGTPGIRLLPFCEGSMESSNPRALSHVPLPEGYTELTPGPNPDHFAGKIFMEASSPVMPPQQLFLDLTQLACLEPLTPGPQAERAQLQRYDCEVVSAQAPDGAKVPITLAYKKGFTGVRPLLLTAYGAYGMCADTSFKPERISLLERGWAVAVAHIRGGGELGHAWHRSATGAQKAQSVTDLEACMDWLVQQGYGQHGSIALEAHSAGALPAAALMNSRPRSIAALLLHAPLVDLLGTMTDVGCPLRAHEAGEFGDPCADAEALDAMLSLCPYSNLRPGQLPAVLIRVGLDDVRVPAWGPAKYAARLRQCQQGPAPILLIARPGGHFAHEHDGLAGTSEDFAFLLHVMASRHPVS